MDAGDRLVTIRRSWAGLAGVERLSALQVVVDDGRRRLGRNGWLALLLLDGTVTVVAPTEDLAADVRARLAPVVVGASAAGPDAASLEAALPPAAARIGPAHLAYWLRSEAPPVTDDVELVQIGNADVGALVAACSEADVDESGIEAVTSRLAVVRERGVIVAGAGYRTWPGGLAHLSVLTAPSARGRGLAAKVGAAATEAALAAGLVPQWRAVPIASRIVARRLGFTELGVQVGLDIEGHRGRRPKAT